MKKRPVPAPTRLSVKLPRIILRKPVGVFLRECTRLLHAAGVDSAGREAEEILCWSRNCERIDLYLKRSEYVSVSEQRKVLRVSLRRIQGMPLQYLIGQEWFWGLRFLVGPGVLIPRPETELVVEQVIRLATGHFHAAARILEIGCGSGNIAIALTKELPSCKIYTSERSRRALSWARKNTAMHQVDGKIVFLAGDCWQPVRQAGCEAFDIIVSNPPYVTTAEMLELPPEVRREPVGALAAGSDGLRMIRRILTGGRDFLRPSGFIVMEIGAQQRGRVTDLFSRVGGFSAPEFSRDLADKTRIVTARRTANG